MSKILIIISFFLVTLGTSGQVPPGFNTNPTVGIKSFNPGSVNRAVYDPIGDVVYITGTYDAATSSPDFDPDPQNVFSLPAHGPAGTIDIFVARYGQDGTFIGAISIGGIGDDLPLGVDLDASGNIYVVGAYDSPSLDLDPGVGSQTLGNSGGFDGFAVVLNSFGNFVMGSGANTAGQDQVRSVMIDNFGDAVITGNINSNMFYERYSGGDLTILPDFSYVIPGATSRELLLDSNDDIIVCGVFENTVDFDPIGTANRIAVANRDFFIAHYNGSDGSLLDVKAFGGAGDELLRRVAIGPSNEIIFTGLFNVSFDADPDPVGTNVLSTIGLDDFFISKFNSDLTLAWSFEFGGTGNDDLNGVYVNSFGEIFTAGKFNGTIDFDPVGTYEFTSTSDDAFLFKLNGDGTFGKAIALGNAGSDEIETLLPIGDAVSISFTRFNTLNADLDPNCDVITLNEYTYGWLGYQDVAIVAQPVAQATNLTFPIVTASSITGQFTPAPSGGGAPHGYLVLMSAGDFPNIDPVDGFDYCLNDQLGTNGVGEIIYAVANGDINSFTTFGHTSNEQLFYKIFSYRGFGSATNYNTTSPLIGSQTTLTAPPLPTIQASNLQFTNVTNTSATVSWSRGNGSQVLVIGRAASANVEFPQLGISYAGSPLFGSAEIGVQNYGVYVGTETSVNLTNLAPGTTYHFSAFEFNGVVVQKITTTTSSTGNPSSFTTASVCVGVTSGPTITNNTPATVNQGSPINVSVTVISPSGCPVTGVTMLYGELDDLDVDDPLWNVVDMTSGSSNVYTATIPGDKTSGSGVTFNIEATNPIDISYSDEYSVSINIPDDAFTIPYTSFGAQETNYRIVSIPLTGSGFNGAINNVFDELGPYDKTKWRMYSYNGSSTSEMNGNSVMSIGQGYWLIARENPGQPLTVGGGNTPNVTLYQPYTINLRAGWNLIGNPYTHDISWTDILAWNGDPIEVDDVIKLYKGSGSYTDGNELERFSGGFVFSDAIVPLQIPAFRDPSIQGGRVGKREDSGRIQNSIDQSNWEVPLVLVNGGIENLFGGIGMNLNANDEFDRFDDLTLPRFLNYVEIVHDNDQKFNSYFTKDVVPTSDNYVWEFSVESSTEDQIVELKWENNFFGENTKQLYLWDNALLRFTDMRAATNYTFDKSVSKSFKIIYGDTEFVKKEIDLKNIVIHQLSPNPAHDKVTVSFTVPSSQSSNLVSIRTFDLMGRNMWSHEASYGEGYHEATWHINSQIAGGIYIIKVNSGTSSDSRRLLIKK